MLTRLSEIYIYIYIYIYIEVFNNFQDIRNWKRDLFYELTLKNQMNTTILQYHIR